MSVSRFQGPWFYTSKRIESSLRHLNFPNGISSPIYAGRDVSAATATGDKKIHDAELAQLLEDALNLRRTTHSYLEKYIQTTNATSSDFQHEEGKRKERGVRPTEQTTS